MVNEFCFRNYVNSVDSPSTLLYYKVLLLYCPRFSAIIQGVSYSFMYLRFLSRHLIFVLNTLKFPTEFLLI
jgi:hypothetical protein